MQTPYLMPEITPTDARKEQPMDDLWKLTATQAARLIHDGKLNPIDLTEACLARIADREPAVHAFAHFDPGHARNSAASARPGPLRLLPD